MCMDMCIIAVFRAGGCGGISAGIRSVQCLSAIDVETTKQAFKSYQYFGKSPLAVLVCNRNLFRCHSSRFIQPVLLCGMAYFVFWFTAVVTR